MTIMAFVYKGSVMFLYPYWTYFIFIWYLKYTTYIFGV